jgi:hypothetical protein
MADTAVEPLMGRPQNDDEAEDVELSDVSLLLEKNLKNPGVFVWLLTFSAGISGLLFGCKLGFYFCGNLLMIAGQMTRALFLPRWYRSEAPSDTP